ncbi:MAG: tRNA (guanosine(37)-N1)-methyltransferase TrmD [Myxococcota bacterium]
MSDRTPYRFDIVTLFPELCLPYAQGAMLGRAHKAGIIDVSCTDPRTFATDAHRSVDDGPFGGGAGMVMMPEPLAQAVEQVRATRSPARVVLLSPAGRTFTQDVAKEYAALGSLALVCGRYEGVDERVARHVVDEELSIGDFVLTGGELGALCVVDAVSRLLPGVLGHAQGADDESFSNLPLLEHPQYTRPREWRGHAVPDVLLSGNHKSIDAWRLSERLERTRLRRPDLWARYAAWGEPGGPGMRSDAPPERAAPERRGRS